jgi:ATP-dependent Clp protease ATP-binding subunit ClpC
MFERYTESARRALFFARYETGQRGRLSIESEHLLLGVLREDNGPVSRLLAKLQVPPPTLLREVDGRTRCRESVPPSAEIPFSEETKHCLNFAMQEADRFQHNHIGPEHLFLGLLRADGSLAASILTDQGVTLEKARDEIGSEPPPPSPADETTAGAGRLEAIKLLVEQLGRTDANSIEGRSLVARIHSAIDALKPHLGAP